MENSPFQDKIRSFFGHVPNKEQADLFLELESFLRARDLLEIMLVKGYAGTGKTTVLASFVKTLDHFKIKSKLMAPTGRAAKVLGGMAGKQATTIHRGIYWRKSKTDMSSPFTLKPNLSKNTVFIVDEASMIGDGGIDEKTGMDQRDLLSDLIEHIYQGKGCQLVLIGDNGQLPPVGNPDSPALSKEFINYHYPKFNVRVHQLSEVHRQALKSSILRNATSLRSTASAICFDLEKANDLVRISGLELQHELENAYDHYGKEGTLIITRSNKSANQYNQQLRGRVFWYEEPLVGGDQLMVVRNNYFWQNETNSIDFIANGEMIQVLRIKGEEELYGFKFFKAVIGFPDNKDFGDLEVYLHAETLESESPNLSRSRMKDLFFAVEEDYKHLRSKKERYEAILKDPYFNALQVKYAYAVTCHKAQGGQWDCVFIDQGYLPEDAIDESYKRWLYTALTRAKVKAFLVNFNDDFFIQNH